MADSRKVKGADGNIKVVVPTIENRIGNNSVNIRRLFIFDMNGNVVKSGNIVQFVGRNGYDVNDHLNDLIANAERNSIPDFNGTILTISLADL